ncbi:MAG: 4-diphosphocytidyl-2-C-methyl-D-erythritol kinase [Chlamydiales bacterium]|nr:4-diphosphocytidyl-2-C-methyl-D-erythritol kinase [Chlamydiales bacterium]
MPKKRLPSSLTLSSPAKVNLFLRILGKRRDGFHELASLFHTIDLADTLTFTLSKEDALICTDSSIGPNLVTRAVELFRKKSGLNFAVSIHLEKKIPTEAGLGGGSSNAATTLIGLNALLGSPITVPDLQTWSAELGSDVPFFFSSGAAYCTGRGEIVRDLPGFRLDQSLKIYKPKGGLSTPKVYQALNLDKCSQEDPEALLESFLAGKPVFHNDLEAPAFRLRPSLREVKERLEGTMSGSGTAFFTCRPHRSFSAYSPDQVAFGLVEEQREKSLDIF